VTVDVEVVCAVELACAGDAPCFVVVSNGKIAQRYVTKQTKIVAAEAKWSSEEVTLTMESSAAWFDVHVFSLSGSKDEDVHLYVVFVC
jgi:hypothetical protein